MLSESTVGAIYTRRATHGDSPLPDRHTIGLDFEPETVNAELTFLDVRFESGEAIEAAVGHTFERPYRAFDIRRDGTIFVPPGRYRMWNGTVEACTAPFRRIAGEVEFERRAFWTGTRTDYGAELTLRPWPGVRFTGLWQRSDVDLAEGAFHTGLVRAEAGLDLTPWTSLTANVQYDNLRLGLYARFRWILQPGSEAHLQLSLLTAREWGSGKGEEGEERNRRTGETRRRRSVLNASFLRSPSFRLFPFSSSHRPHIPHRSRIPPQVTKARSSCSGAPTRKKSVKR